MFLQLILYDGNYYEYFVPSKSEERLKRPAAKGPFEKHTIKIDLSKMNNIDLDEQSQTDKYSMLNISGLNKSIDSLNKKERRRL